MRSHKEYLNNCFVNHASRDDSKFVVGGVLLGGVATALTSNAVLGGAIAILGYGLAFKQVYDDGKRIRLMGETGAVAPFLKGEDYQRYIDTFGTDEADKQAICILRLGAQPYGDAMEGLEQRYPGIEEKLDELPAIKPGAIYFDPIPVEPINASIDDSKLAIGDLTAATVNNSNALPVTDIAEVMGKLLKPTIISALPRSGKGVLLANAWRAAKRHHPDLKVFVIDPKAHPDESGYWAGCDRVLAKRFDQIPVNDPNTISEVEAFIEEWRNDPSPKKLLIFDEQILVDSKLPKWAKDNIPALAKSESSAGETWQRYLWLVMQSPLVKDIGLSGGSRSIFAFCAIATNRPVEGMNPTAWMNSAKASGFIPSIPTDEQFQGTPRGVLCYSSLVGEWTAMPEYPVPASPIQPPAISQNLVQTPAISENLHQPIQPPQQNDDPWLKVEAELLKQLGVITAKFESGELSPQFKVDLQDRLPAIKQLIRDHREDLLRIILLSMERGYVKARHVQQTRKKCFEGMKPEAIRSLFNELDEMGIGELIGDDEQAGYRAFKTDEREVP